MQNFGKIKQFSEFLQRLIYKYTDGLVFFNIFNLAEGYLGTFFLLFFLFGVNNYITFAVSLLGDVKS